VIPEGRNAASGLGSTSAKYKTIEFGISQTINNLLKQKTEKSSNVSKKGGKNTANQARNKNESVRKSFLTMNFNPGATSVYKIKSKESSVMFRKSATVKTSFVATPNAPSSFIGTHSGPIAMLAKGPGHQKNLSALPKSLISSKKTINPAVTSFAYQSGATSSTNYKTHSRVKKQRAAGTKVNTALTSAKNTTRAASPIKAGSSSFATSSVNQPPDLIHNLERAALDTLRSVQGNTKGEFSSAVNSVSTP